MEGPLVLDEMYLCSRVPMCHES